MELFKTRTMKVSSKRLVYMAVISGVAWNDQSQQMVCLHQDFACTVFACQSHSLV